MINKTVEKCLFTQSKGDIFHTASFLNKEAEEQTRWET